MVTSRVQVAQGCEDPSIFEHLPPDWAPLARTHRAFSKPGAVADVGTLLQLLLRHVEPNDSLKRTTAMVAAEGGPILSSVALHKRLTRAADWLQALVHGMGARVQTPLPELGRRVVLVDATVITQPGSTGTDWRLHTLVNLADLRLIDAVVTDAAGGERLDQFPLQPGDLVRADRGYAHPATVAYALDCGADVLLRWKAGRSGLRGATGEPFDLSARLAAVAPRRSRVDWVTTLRTTDGTLLPGRLLAEREGAGWLLFWTTLPAADYTAHQIAELYRARWQVELTYKRHKSLLGGGKLLKFRADTARAWLLAKVLCHQLIQAEVAALLAAATSLPPAPARNAASDR